MKKILFISALAVASVSASISVSASQLSGVYVGGVFGLYDLDVNYKSSAGTFGMVTDGLQGGAGLQLGFGIDFPFLNMAIFSLGLEAKVRNEAGSVSFDSGLLAINMTTSDVKSISILPGMYVHKKGLLYARFGKGNADVTATITASGVSSKTTENEDFTVIGLGYKNKVNENIAWSIEYSRVTGGDSEAGVKTDFTSNAFELGVQYYF
jgi:opacity protein-like surface antigen